MRGWSKTGAEHQQWDDDVLAVRQAAKELA